MVYNLTRAIERNALRSPDVAAVLSGDVTLTHGQFERQVRAVAAGLRAGGIGPGDVVAMLVANSSEFLVTTFAINGVGAIFLPLNLRLAGPEWSYIIGHSEARALVVDQPYSTVVASLRASCPDLKIVIGIRGATDTNVSFEDFLRDHDGDVTPFAQVDEHDVSRLMYTSGTTARPKGVPLTYRNVLWKIFDHTVEFGLTQADRALLAGPMYHVGAYDLPGIGNLYVGGSLVILPQFDALAVMKAIEVHSITNVWLAPAMVNAILMLDGLADFDTRSVRFITNGGEKMPVALIEKFLSVFSSAWLADSFGMTETVSGDTFLDPTSTLTKLGSVGKPVLHLDARVVDEADRDVEPGVPGELLLRGPKVFGGYLKDPEATRAAFVDGWFRTGDMAHIDTDGYLFIDDRKKDMIVSGGENIASPEIERVLYLHPAVLEAAVVAMPDERWGEVPKAVVALKPGCDATAEELLALCAQHLAKFKVPKRVEFVETLPRTSTGKILKRDLR